MASLPFRVRQSKVVSPDSIPGFPRTEYSMQSDAYRELEKWYTGEALKEQYTTKKGVVDKFPIKINPIYRGVNKHAQTLFGEILDGESGPLVAPNIRNKKREKDDTTDALEDALVTMLTDSSAISTYLRNGIWSQIYGNSVLRLAYDPFSEFITTKVRLDGIPPYEFVGFPYHDDPWRFRQAWIIRKITRDQAEEYGIEVNAPECYYVEKWEPRAYSIYINGEPLSLVMEDDEHVFNGDNPFGFVPFIRIPHILSVSALGDSLITQTVQGLIKEYNSRFADAGDATLADTHTIGVMKNVRGNPTVIDLMSNLRVVNLGSSQSLTGSTDKEPALEFPGHPRLSDSVLGLLNEIYKEYRREVALPSVAEGEDEGSQRSSLTLTTRLQPLSSHIKMERINWNVGLAIMYKMALMMMSQIGTISATREEILGLKYASKWAPTLPRDRDLLMNEIAVRSANDIGSTDHFIEMAGDIENIEEELKRILDWKRKIAEIEAASQPEPAFGTSQPATAKKPAKKAATTPKKSDDE